ncbi:hypothetical protein [Brevundimonas sp. A19_0]|uniref:hypothetical protein n=1 Tax=Brevundimonas sp. A19_0 TaxID=2821087 RepID=UPI001ADBDDB6|nr:hypothetical protein [Brevundimonas sp. A19_0]MBO9500514.1 hypothetical protein [Brevundimonas sp. A19_0]
MTDAEERLLYALALMGQQYLQTPTGDLDHVYMGAGEEAIALLAEYGLVEPSVRGGEWTAAGQALLTSRRPPRHDG